MVAEDLVLLNHPFHPVLIPPTLVAAGLVAVGQPVHGWDCGELEATVGILLPWFWLSPKTVSTDNTAV